MPPPGRTVKYVRERRFVVGQRRLTDEAGEIDKDQDMLDAR